VFIIEFKPILDPLAYFNAHGTRKQGLVSRKLNLKNAKGVTMKTVAKMVEPAERHTRFDHIQPLYLEALTLVERLHRRLLDVIKDEFDRRGRADINAVQALLLFNVGEKELTAGELRTRGYYLGSNVSYNLKKLVEMGFLDHQRSRVDRRSVRIKLTDQGREVRDIVESLYEKHVRTVEQVGGITADEFAGLNKALQRLERFWTDQILYRL
jgi:DNA-binding MarR family transcriptional regulator